MQIIKSSFLFFFITLFSLNTSILFATEDDESEQEIITPEIAIDLGTETEDADTGEIKEPESTIYQPQDNEPISTAYDQESIDQGPLTILNEVVSPGETRELSWSAGQSFSGKAVKPPVLIVRGLKSGPVLCLVSAIHGDELNGIEIVRRVVSNLDATEIAGTVIGVPIVNIFGFTDGSRYLPDRRDLNRFFPGKSNGSAASRIAYRFFNQIITHCDLVVDFHTGSFKRNNLPQLRADMNEPHVREFVRHFGSTSVLHKSGHKGNLRTAATRAGIPAVTFELGQPGSLQEEHVEFGVKTIETLIGKLGILKRFHLWFEPQPVYYSSRWVRANSGGILFSKAKIGSKIKKDDLLGYIINPITNAKTEITSPVNGRILGMALNQFMLPGYAAFHIGIVSDSASMVRNEGINNPDIFYDNSDDDLDEEENEYTEDSEQEEDEEMH